MILYKIYNNLLFNLDLINGLNKMKLGFIHTTKYIMVLMVYINNGVWDNMKIIFDCYILIIIFFIYYYGTFICIIIKYNIKIEKKTYINHIYIYILK
jgi:hypothetical protein